MKKRVLDRMMFLLSYKSIVKSIRIPVITEIILRHHFKYEKGLKFSKGINSIITDYLIRNKLYINHISVQKIDKANTDSKINECLAEIISTYYNFNIYDIIEVVPPKNIFNEKWFCTYQAFHIKKEILQKNNILLKFTQSY